MSKVEIERETYQQRFLRIRNQSEKLCSPLHVEDHVPQPVIDVSPPKWHLAHTSWFFENFILKELLPDYKLFHPRYNFIFNSYYDSVGERVARADRGNLTRPTLDEVIAYRAHVNAGMQKLVQQVKDEQLLKFRQFLEIGLQHEQQHQELLLTDLKYILGNNPLYPPYISPPKNASEIEETSGLTYTEIPAGLYNIGFEGNEFCWDNEKPRHQHFLHDFKIANRLITNAEFLEFMNDGGYKDYRFWLSEGWQLGQEKKWEAPMYWFRNEENGRWQNYTLFGAEDVDPQAPVTHINFYEADAYASWAGKRLPTEFEWEAAVTYAGASMEDANFAEKNIFEPMPAKKTGGLQQAFGDCWEWTYSSYHPYPGYKRAAGPLGEYNGKFMINQMVLRGGSCATPQDHFRLTYRNFFHPHLHWQFTGIRLAETVSV